MDRLIIGVIILVIPCFFLLVFVSSRMARLKALRKRIVEARVEEPLERYHVAIRLFSESEANPSESMRRLHAECAVAVKRCEQFRLDPVGPATVRAVNEAEGKLTAALEAAVSSGEATEQRAQVEAALVEVKSAMESYNGRVREYREARETFPDRWLAALTGVTEAEFLRV